MGEAGFPLHVGDGFAGLEGLDAWKNRGLVANWIVTVKDTLNGGETQRERLLSRNTRQSTRDGVAISSSFLGIHAGFQKIKEVAGVVGKCPTTFADCDGMRHGVRGYSIDKRPVP
jgi:hypothetical protein